MAFIDQVQDLTSLTVSDNDELSQFLKDGVLDVTNRWLAIRPQDAELFERESSISDSQGLSVGGARIISIIREAGADGSSDGSTAWEPCSKISASMQSRAVDPDSLFYASKYHPVYTMNSDKTINVYPTPSSNNGFKVFYVNEEPRDITNNAALIHSHSDIKYFPNDKVYLVVIYAGMRLLQATMGSNVISTNSVPPDAPVAPSFTAASVLEQTAGSLGTAPTYTRPTVSLTAAPTISNLTISVSAPTTPSDPSISSPTVGAIAIAALPTAPAYTPPVIGGDATELSALEDLDTDNTIDVHADQIEWDQWFATVGHLIEDEEDVELASAQLQKIQAYIATYQSALQNQLNNFNENNVVYQAGIQRNLQQAQIDMQDAHKEADLTLQAALQDYTLELQLFQAEVAKYQAQVNDEVQEYQQNLAGDLQVWQAERTTDLQQYASDIQNELNEFNKENVAYQSTVQEALAELQIAAAKAQKDADFEQQIQIQEYASKIQKYQAELAAYQAEVTAEIQEQSAKMQHYQLLYAQLKAEYDQVFMIAAPKPQQQQVQA
jgi:hypothetical protein